MAEFKNKAMFKILNSTNVARAYNDLEFEE